MKTKIKDVIVPEVFNPYTIQLSVELSALIKSGIVVNSPELDKLALTGGKTLNMPFWNDLDGDDEVLSDSGALSPAGITAGKDIAVLHMRGKAWSVNDLADALSGDDPMAVIATKVAQYWERRRQAILLASLKGIFGSALASTHMLDISTEAGVGDDVISADALVDTAQLLGDHKNLLTGYFMHSKTEACLAKKDLIEYRQDSEGKYTLPTYMGKSVIVDDKCPVTAGVYTTYLFGQGAFGLGNGSAPVPTEMDRDSLAGDDILINRNHFILHPRGVKWTSAVTNGDAPSNTEIENASNWAKVYDDKNIRIVALKHKIVTANKE